MTIEGIDAAWDRPTTGQLVAAGKHFIVGYVSHDKSKNITRAECEAAHAAGIDVCLVWETTSTRALDSGSAGAVDGREARRQARALGFPEDRPIYFAVDFQATTMQLGGPVHSYALSFQHEAGPCGVYGGLATVRFFADHALTDIRYFWQTYAWSSGVWDPRAQVRQYSNGVHIAGHDTDLDRAYAADFGQWSAAPTDIGADMPLTTADLDAIAHRIATGRDLPATNPTESMGSAMLSAQQHATSADTKLDAIAAQLAALPAAIAAAVVAALPAGGGVTSSGDFTVTGTLHADGGAHP